MKKYKAGDLCPKCKKGCLRDSLFEKNGKLKKVLLCFACNTMFPIKNKK